MEPGRRYLYYCNDIFGKATQVEEAKIARAVDLIMVTSPNLYQRLGYTGKAHLMMHGVEEFTRYDFPFRKEKLKTVGYVGTIRDCLDLSCSGKLPGGATAW